MNKIHSNAKKFIISALLLLCMTIKGFCASPVDFYATVSSSNDSNMIRMTTDLFYTQLQSLDGYTVNDKREISFSNDKAISSNIAFYAEIQEDSNGGWICTLNAIKNSENKNVSATKKYGSYYKILLDAKSSLENLLLNLSSNINNNSGISDNPIISNSSLENDENNLDELAGTWIGEEFIDKVIIMRGGRGFVIYKNGASMNITVEASGNKISIKQSARANASFYPEISRQAALQNAAKAPQIQWDLTLTSSNTLEGTKTTLVEDEKNPGSVKTGNLNIKWNKRIN